MTFAPAKGLLHGRAPLATRRLVLGLVLLLGFSTPGLGDPREQQPDAGRTSLHLIHRGPEGPVDSLSFVEVLFSEPMAGAADLAKPLAPLAFEPKLSGRGEWIGSSAFRFRLDAPPEPGTKIRVTVRADTRAVSGNTLSATEAWTIDFAPPRLIASVPSTSTATPAAEAGAESQTQVENAIWNPLTDPIVLEFDRAPAPDAASACKLMAADRIIPLVRSDAAQVDWDRITALLGHVPNQANTLLLQTASEKERGTSYRLLVDRTLPLAGALTLPSEIELRFRTPDELRFSRVEPTEGGCLLRANNPVRPEDLRVIISPALFPVTIRPGGEAPGGSDVSKHDSATLFIEAAFQSGTSYTVTVDAGTRDVFGDEIERAQRLQLDMPTAPPMLAWWPDEGTLIAGPAEFARLATRRTDDVRVRAAWLRAGDMLEALEARETMRRGDVSGRLTWEDRWDVDRTWNRSTFVATRAAMNHGAPDSVWIQDLKLADLPSPPRDAQGLWLEAEAMIAGDTLRATAFLQLTTIAITARVDAEHGLFWITDLETGTPIADADVSLWTLDASPANPPRSKGKAGTGEFERRLWHGKTDETGLVWSPGPSVLAPLGSVDVVRAEVPGRRSFLSLPVPDRDAFEGAALPNDRLRAAVVTDRPTYAPGDRIGWKAWARVAGTGSIDPAAGRSINVALMGSTGALRAPRTLDANGSTGGSILLPADTPEGPVELRIETADGLSTPLARTVILVQSPATTSLDASLVLKDRADQKVDVRLVVRDSDGVPAGALDLDWSVEKQPLPWRAPGWSTFSFRADAEVPENQSAALREATRRAPAALNAQGEATWTLDASTFPSSGDERWTVSVRVGGISAETSRDIIMGPLRVGIRDVTRRPEFGGDPAWEWIVVDTTGQAVRGVPVELSITARSDDPKDETVVFQTTTESGEIERILSVPRKQRGHYVARVQLVDAPRIQVISREGDEPARETKGSALTQVPGTEDTAKFALPATPSAGAHTLFVIENPALARAKSELLRSNAVVDIALDGLFPPAAWIDVVQVGRARGLDPSRAREQLPNIVTARTELPIESDPNPAQIEISRESGPGADTTVVRFKLRGADGKPTSGSIAIALIDDSGYTRDAASVATRGTFFAEQPAAIWRAQTFDELVVSGSLPLPSDNPEKERPSSLETTTPHSSTRTQTLYWNPGVPVPADGEVIARIPAVGASGNARVRVFASTSDGEVGIAEAWLDPDALFDLWIDLPSALRVGDHIQVPVAIKNRSGGDAEAELGIDLTGAELEADTRMSLRIPAKETRVLRIPVEITDPGTVRVKLTLSANGTEVARAEASREVSTEPIRVRRSMRGGAEPRVELELDLDDPFLRSADHVEFLLAPSRLVELVDPLVGITESDIPGRETDLSRLRAWILARNLGSLANGSPLPDGVDREIADGLERLESTVSVDSHSVKDRYLDTYAFWTACIAGSSPDLRERMEDALVTAMAEPGVNREDLALRALQTWIRLAHGRQGGITDADLGDLLSQQQKLGIAGRLCLGLAITTVLDREKLDHGTRVQLEAQLKALLREMNSWESGAVTEGAGGPPPVWIAGLLGEPAPTGLPFASAPDDRFRVSALALRLLTAADVRHVLAPSLLRGLLDARMDGHFANPHEAVFACEAIYEYVSRVEMRRFPIQGRLVLGLMRNEGTHWTDVDVSPERWTYTPEELDALRRADSNSRRLPITVESPSVSGVAYEIAIEKSYASTSAPTLEDGLTVRREYQGGKNGTWPRGVPLEVRLTLAAPHSYEELLVEDPRPGGAARIGDVRCIGGKAEVLSSADPRVIRFRVLPDGPGLVELTYFLWPRDPGDFGVPGTTAGTAYDGAARARGAASRVRFE